MNSILEAAISNCTSVVCIDPIQVSAPTLCSLGVLACSYMVQIVWAV